MLKESLYNLLGKTAGGFFNVLNLLLGGNLPPFGSVCVVVKEEDRYLVLEQSNGKTIFPGGFMRWREDPLETARRECEEETGLQVRVLDMIDCFSCPAISHLQMSTLTLVYSAKIVGGSLRQAIEGRPCWFSETEAQRSLDPRHRLFFENYLRYYHQRAEVSPDAERASASASS